MRCNNMRWLCGWLVLCLLFCLISAGLAEDVQLELIEVNNEDEELLLEVEDDQFDQDDIIEDMEEPLFDIDGELELDGLSDDLEGLIPQSQAEMDAMLSANGSYLINGKTVYATMVDDPGNGQCWAYANSIYSIIWGVRFDSTFTGSSGTGFNMLRNLGDGDRTLTTSHLKDFISQASLGSVIRIGGCTSSCSHFNNDGLKCGHSGHSLILVAKNDSGFTTFERLTGPGRREKAWTWESFCNAYSGYPYIKYIKWPNAPVYGGSQPVVTASTLQFTNVVYPKTFRINTTAGFALSGGTVESNYDLRTLKTQILNSSGSAISSTTVSISGKSYAIRNLDTYSSNDNGVKFSYIKTPGNYKWVLTATDSNGRNLSLEMPFTAVSSGTTVTATASRKWTQNDTSAPTITSVKVTNITSEGYTISCYVSDNVGVTSVKFPTWTEYNGQDDIIWHEGSLSGGTASYTVRVSDHRNERGCMYITHIYAYDAAGNSSCYGVNVNVPAPTVAVTGVSLSKSELSLTVGGSTTLVATVFPSNATDKTLVWSSSNAAVVIVSADGVVTAKGAGTATVTAATMNGKSASCRVKVNAAAVPTIAPTAKPTDTPVVSPTIMPTVEPTITPVTSPTIAPTSDPSIVPEAINLNKTKATLVVGATLKLAAEISPEHATTALIWSSSNQKVATVSDEGNVRAVAKGTTTITVMTENGMKATCKVTVPKAPTKVKFGKKTYTVKKGKTIKLTPKISPSGAKTIYKWSSSNSKIAKVSSKGVV